MGMGYAASYADVISFEDIKKIVGEPAEEFEALLNSNDEQTPDDFCYDAQHGLDEVSEDVAAAWHNVSLAFRNITGASVFPGYHSDEDGDRYDELDGSYFSVDGIYQVSPAGEKIRELTGNVPQRLNFVCFG
jgi:hypothetical protein